jgi:hypothetical protein
MQEPLDASRQGAILVVVNSCVLYIVVSEGCFKQSRLSYFFGVIARELLGGLEPTGSTFWYQALSLPREQHER